MMLRSPRRFDPSVPNCDDESCSLVLLAKADADHLVDLKLAADDARRKGDHARARQLRAEFESTKASSIAAARAAALAASDHAHQKGLLVMIDASLLQAAQSLGVKADGLDERSLAMHVLAASGVNPSAPCSSTNSTRIADREPVYIVARAVSAAEYARRDAADASRRDSFATAGPAGAPSCGCGGSAGKNDAIGTERAARERMVQAGRLAHVSNASPERIDEVKTLDAYDRKRSTAIANTRPGGSRSDGTGDREARAKAAMVNASANAWRTQADDNAIDEE